MSNNEQKIEITYRQEGDVLLPNIEVSETERNINLTKFGLMRKTYLQQKYPGRFNYLCMTETLMQHCAEIQQQALDMKDTVMEQLKGQYQPPKKTDFMANLQYNNMINDLADDIVIPEIVYGE